jgi:hypothetical protein
MSVNQYKLEAFPKRSEMIVVPVHGGDYDEAVRNEHEALALYADGNDDMPEPRSLEEIMAKSNW